MITALLVVLFLVVAYAIGVLVGFVWKPRSPTLLFGIGYGPIRWENGMKDLYFDHTFWIVVFARPIALVERSEKFWFTHLQYKTSFGLLLFWPTILHLWTQPRKQATEANPNATNDPSASTLRVPGSELCVPYARLPGWRKQGDGTYIFTRGFFGGHWD